MKHTISPLSKSNLVEFEKSIKTKDIIARYKRFNIDVTRFFLNNPRIDIYKCTESGYKFYYPFNVSGDSKFYEHFQNFDWYYMPWKWEHEITKNYLKDGLSVLEVGCARGAFIKKINDLFSLNTTVGLELNESAVIKTDKWCILNETVQDFSKTNQEKFDIVCSYQVLEHIAEVKSFLEAKIDCLKKGGKLIISVPNNDSYIKYADNCLNEPPHHMGLWNETSLLSLENLFPVKVLKVYFEELQDYHVEHYVSALHYNKYSTELLRKVMRKTNKILGIHQKLINRVIQNKKEYIGQTILVVYEKI